MKLSANATNQRQRILACLKNRPGGATTLELLNELDILRPGARVCELRQQGHKIATEWPHQETHLGRHKIARYVLLKGH